MTATPDAAAIETVQQLLRTRREQDTVAVALGERTWTWREHLAEAEAEAAALIALADPARPLHVGTLLANGPAMLRAMAAAGLGGYVLCGINTTRRGEGLLADVRRSECQVLLVDAEHAPLLEGLDLTGIRVLDVEAADFVDAVASAGSLIAHREVEPLDTFMMIFTSGTSGDPKAVRFSHVMAIFCGLTLVDQWQLTPDDVCYLAMPLFHSNGIAAGWAAAVGGGARMVPAKFSATSFLHDVRRHGVTYLNYVGKPLAYVLATPEQPDDADNTLRLAFGNEATDRDIADFSRRFDCRVVDSFGSTELAVVVTREDGTPPGSIGKGYPGVAIYDSETVAECAVAIFDEHGALTNADEAVGELVNTEGGGLFGGYYNDPAADSQRMRHGMYWSGDLAYRDADGWIYLAGRTADWMRVDGENLAAAPIERILQRLPALSRVAVYAVPDASGGDQMMVAMVLRDDAALTPADLEAFLADQPDLSPRSWPRHVRIEADLPSTATNKILKRELIGQGVTAGGGTLWERAERGTSYAVVGSSLVTTLQPLPAGETGLVSARPGPDLAAAGYLETEYLARGTACSYAAHAGGQPSDGHWDLHERDRADFATRVVVRRPADEAEWSGTLIVEWLNVSSGSDAAPDWIFLAPEIVRQGHAYAGVSAQHVGVEGGHVTVAVSGFAPVGLRANERYADLHHPGDAYAYDMYTQVTKALAAELYPTPPSCLLAVGESQSAYALSTYVDGVQPVAEVFDGFLIHSRGKAAMPLGEPGEGIDLATFRADDATLVRDDLDAAVLIVETEGDLVNRLDYLPARQPDGQRLRVWEIAGTAHADRYIIGEFESFLGCPEPVNRGQQAYVVRAALRHLEVWARGGAAAPSAPPIALSGPGVLEVDEIGNAVGGVRTPAVDAPVDLLSGLSAPGAPMICQLFGSSRELSGEALLQRYGSPEGYLVSYEKALDAAIDAGFVLAEDRDEVLAEARPDVVQGSGVEGAVLAD